MRKSEFPKTFKFEKHKCPYCRKATSTEAGKVPTRGGADVLRCPHCQRAYYLTWLGPWDGKGRKRQREESDFCVVVFAEKERG